jgi:hypothetical protein
MFILAALGVLVIVAVLVAAWKRARSRPGDAP